jgi:hypothetical protein
LQDHARADSNQHVVAAVLNPLIAAWWRLQMMAAPVVDDVLAVTVFRRQAVATVKCLIRAGTATIAMIVMTLVAAAVTATITTAVAAAVIVIVTTLITLIRTAILCVYDWQGATCKGCGEQGRNDSIIFHWDSL